MQNQHPPKINGERLWQSLMEMARIGATEKGGSCRLALTDEDKAGRDLFVRWCRAAGCSVEVDRMGNIFARRAGNRPELSPVLVGSHLDTQPTGGRFDGVYGVLTGLEIIRTLLCKCWIVVPKVGVLEWAQLSILQKHSYEI